MSFKNTQTWTFLLPSTSSFNIGIGYFYSRQLHNSILKFCFFFLFFLYIFQKIICDICVGVLHHLEGWWGSCRSLDTSQPDGYKDSLHHTCGKEEIHKCNLMQLKKIIYFTHFMQCFKNPESISSHKILLFKLTFGKKSIFYISISYLVWDRQCMH